MTNPQLQQSLIDLAAIPQGLVGICAETIDGRHLVEINADEVFPAASSIDIRHQPAHLRSLGTAIPGRTGNMTTTLPQRLSYV